jgi:hypothetical protein
VSSADLQTVVNGVVDLAGIGAVWSLFYFRRVLFAASPKPQQSQPEGEKKQQPKEPPKAPAADPDTAPIQLPRPA